MFHWSKPCVCTFRGRLISALKRQQHMFADRKGSLVIIKQCSLFFDAVISLKWSNTQVRNWRYLPIPRKSRRIPCRTRARFLIWITDYTRPIISHSPAIGYHPLKSLEGNLINLLSDRFWIVKRKLHPPPPAVPRWLLNVKENHISVICQDIVHKWEYSMSIWGQTKSQRWT